MWQPLKIKDENYFFQCELLEDGSVYYLLSDLKFVWSENISMELFLTKVKDSNRRIEYTSETVLKTIKTNIPAEIIFNSEKKDNQQDNKLMNLSLKYYVSGHPLNFSWNLKVCEQTEFLNLITNPLLLLMSCLSRQNNELVEIIRKKDIEIEQYKQEGAILKRTKIATELYNDDKFKQKFPKILLSENLLKYANENFDNLKTSCKDFIQENDIIEDLSNNGNSSGITVASVHKKSPVKSRKKRFLQNQQQILEQRLKARERKIDYEDSDSPCSPPIIENPEVAEIKKRLSELKRQHEEDLQSSKEKTMKN